MSYIPDKASETMPNSLKDKHTYSKLLCFEEGIVLNLVFRGWDRKYPIFWKQTCLHLQDRIVLKNIFLNFQRGQK